MTSTLRNFLQRLRRAIISGPGIFAAAFFLYLSTLAPGVYAYDSAELATGAFTLGIVHPTGYPAYLLLGKLFTFLPVGDIAYRLNVMSAFFSALTIMFIYWILGKLIPSREIAWVAAAFLGVSSSFWQGAVVAEVYSLHTAFMALSLLLLLQWRRTQRWQYLAAFAFTYGLSLTNHTSGILFLPGFACIAIPEGGLRIREHWRWVLSAAALFLLGLTPYLYLPLISMGNPEINYLDNYRSVDLTSLSGMLWMVSGRAYRFFAFGYQLAELPAELARFAALLWRNFLGVGVLFGTAGLVSLWRECRRLAIGLLLVLIPYVVFFVNYRVGDKDSMFLPAFVIWSIFLAAGMQAVQSWVQQHFDSQSMRLAAGRGITLLCFSFLIPSLLFNGRWANMSDVHTPEEFALDVIHAAEPGAIVLADWSPAVILEYYQIVEGLRPDLVIVNRSRARVARYYELWEAGMQHSAILAIIEQEEIELVAGLAKDRPIHIIGYDPLFAGEYEYLPEGSFFRLVPSESDA